MSLKGIFILSQFLVIALLLGGGPLFAQEVGQQVEQAVEQEASVGAPENITTETSPALTEQSQGPVVQAEQMRWLAANVGPVEAVVAEILDHRTLRLRGFAKLPEGAYVGILSASKNNELIAVARLDVSSRQTKTKGEDPTAQLIQIEDAHLIRVGDGVRVLSLAGENALYRGRTSLLVREQRPDVSSRYRPLVVQGFSIGETAQVLYDNEFLISMYGHLGYGVTPWLTMGTLAPASLLQSPNLQSKMRVWSGDHDTVSFGLSVTKLRDDPKTALNMTIYWDSITSGRMISHTLATFAVATIENAEDTVAVKTAGTSSFQTGYELILPSWDRLLFGPNYNFETKNIGGYLAYKSIWDRAHVSVSLSTVNIRELKLDPRTGYLALIEAYWRF